MKKLFIVAIISFFAVSCGAETEDTVEKNKENTIVSKEITVVSEATSVEELSSEQREMIISMFEEPIALAVEAAGLDPETADEAELNELNEKGEASYENSLKNVQKAFPNIGEEEVQLLIAPVTMQKMAAANPGIVDEMKDAQQRARDTGRLATLRTIQVVLMTYFQDYATYPDSLSDENLKTLFRNSEVPTDYLDGQTIDGCEFGYKYEALEKDEIKNGGYILSACMESENRKAEAKNDGGNDDMRYEIGSDL